MIDFYRLENRVRRNVLVSTDHGLMIVNRYDCNHQQVGQGQWLLDHGSVATVESWLCIEALDYRQDPVIFDIGANIGNFMTWMAKYYPQGRVYAIEPQRAVFQQLTGNAAINNLYNVYTYNCAIGAHDHVITFQEPNYFTTEDFGIFSLVQDKIPIQDGASHTIDVYALDSFVEHFSVPKVDLLKIDAEGMDLDVLHGATKTIRDYHPVIFVEHCDNQRSIRSEIEDYLRAWGYQFVIQGNNLLCT